MKWGRRIVWYDNISNICGGGGSIMCIGKKKNTLISCVIVVCGRLGPRKRHCESRAESASLGVVASRWRMFNTHTHTHSMVSSYWETSADIYIYIQNFYSTPLEVRISSYMEPQADY